MLRLLKLAAMAKHDTGNEQPPDKRIAAAILVEAQEGARTSGIFSNIGIGRVLYRLFEVLNPSDT